MTRVSVWIWALGLSVLLWPRGELAVAAPKSEERGVFTLYKFAKAIGQETYTLRSRGDGIAELRDDFLFTDRGTKVPLKTMLLADRELRPLTFATDGSSSRTSELHDTVEVAGDRVRITRDAVTTEAAEPKDAFVIDGYAPVAMQELMMRFWMGRGRPAALPILPAGTVRIQAAATMSVRGGNGTAEELSGFTVGGLIWGGESLWLDQAGQLVALVSTDAEFDHFEAVREGYEGALPQFIQGAATANLATLAELGAAARRAAPRRMAIVGATLIDGTGGTPVEDSAVLLEGDRIVAAGARAAVRIPRGTETLDARGKWLLPGLWDMHAHFEQVEWGPIYLASGVTTVRDCGNEFDFITTVRDALRDGRGIGPEILMAGIVDGSGPRSLGATIADTPEQARAVVARYKAAGALEIKLYSSIKPALVPVFAAEAHRLGMTVTGHVPTGMTATEAVLAGMDQINHASYPAMEFANVTERRQLPADVRIDFNSERSRRLMEVFRSHGTVFDPTLALFELVYHPERVAVASFEPGVEKVAPQLAYGLARGGVDVKQEASTTAWYRAMVATVRALHAAGLPIVAGTDQAVPGYSLHRELELYVEAGMTPMEAIESATSVPARAMGLSDRVGTVRAGQRADLLLLDADPLADIRATRRVWRTVAAGAVYEPGPLWRSVGFVP